MVGTGDTENLTLSQQELDRCSPVKQGKRIRAYCPYHGSDKQRSLSVDTERGSFKCFACGAWGYMEDARERFSEERARERGFSSAQSKPASGVRNTPPRKPYAPPEDPAPREDLAELLAGFQKALPGSPGEKYLSERGIPLELAQRVGVGYAPPGSWPNPKRDFSAGRVVFPHTRPDGSVVSLYGRAAGEPDKRYRHDHLPGAKGYFNAQALNSSSEPVTVCEGAFDALALMAAGLPNVVAIFGAGDWRWQWAKPVREIIFALDDDETGNRYFREYAPEARLRGKKVAYLEPDAYGAEKDASAAWKAQTLTVGDWGALFSENRSAVSPQEPRKDTPLYADTPSLSWSDAIRRSNALEPKPWYAGVCLAYDYLEDGPNYMLTREAELREEVRALSAESEIPEELAIRLVAWSRAQHMAMNRAPDDLPDVWGGTHPWKQAPGSST